jgi:hypothetical protein
MSAYSGNEGRVLIGASLDVNELREWSLDYGADIHVYGSRALAGGKGTVAGNAGGTGKIVVNYDQQDPISRALPTGSLVSMQLKCTGDGKVCSGTARIGQHHYNPKNSGEEQVVTVDFTTHDVWTLPI